MQYRIKICLCGTHHAVAKTTAKIEGFNGIRIQLLNCKQETLNVVSLKKKILCGNKNDDLAFLSDISVFTCHFLPTMLSINEFLSILITF